MKTSVITGRELTSACEILRGGGLVAVPTETVYGLAADAVNPDAVEALYVCKGRPRGKPISLLVDAPERVVPLCRDIPNEAYLLAERFWPGPLTIVLKKSELVHPIVSAGLDTVGIRCPDHPVTLELLRLFGGALATPSANPSGAPSPTDAGQVLAYFDGLIPCIIDGGPCTVGVASTIVDLTGKDPKILRQGVLRAEEIFKALGREELLC